jgi:hypothetical protein
MQVETVVENDNVIIGSVRNPESTWTPSCGCSAVGADKAQGKCNGRTSVLNVRIVLRNATPGVRQTLSPGVSCVL